MSFHLAPWGQGARPALKSDGSRRLVVKIPANLFRQINRARGWLGDGKRIGFGRAVSLLLAADGED